MYVSDTLRDEVLWRGLTLFLFKIFSLCFLATSASGILFISPKVRESKFKGQYFILVSLFFSLILAMIIVFIVIHALGFRYFGWD